MDERELANRVVEIIDQAAYRNSVPRILSVRLAIGGRRALDLDRLRATFGDVSRGTVAQGASLLIERLPVRRRCRNCALEFEGMAEEAACPRCDHPYSDPVSGEEVRLLEIEVDEA